MNSPGDLRLFLAIPIPKFVRLELLRLQERLRPLLPRRSVRWTKPEQFHLTLKFLGNVPATETAALTEAARAACAAAPAMRLRAEGAGFSPDNFSPRIFWVDIQSVDGLLVGFQRQLVAAVQRFAEKRETKKFTAHVTLARLDKSECRDLEKFKTHARTAKTFGEWTARDVELIQSTLSPSGSIYVILAGLRTKNE